MMDAVYKCDDWLLDRVYQPVADYAAEYDITTAHLSSGLYALSGAVIIIMHPVKPVGIMLGIGSFLLSFIVAMATMGDRRLLYRSIRISSIYMTLFFVVLTHEVYITIFNTIVACALYFLSCDNNKPKRRRWKELKEAVDRLWDWIPASPVRT